MISKIIYSFEISSKLPGLSVAVFLIRSPAVFAVVLSDSSYFCKWQPWYLRDKRVRVDKCDLCRWPGDSGA